MPKSSPSATIVPSTAMVLAAGHGTRLRPLTTERPKPLLEVLGRPLASYALDHARRIGASRAILNTHHLGSQISARFKQSYRAPLGKLSLQYSNERTLLGTGGGLKKMWGKLTDHAPVKGPVLILNADALIDLDTDALVKTFAQRAMADEPHCLSTMVLQQAKDAARYGVIGTDAQNRVVHFAGRANAPGFGHVVKERMFCGVHLVDPALFDMVPSPPYGEGGVCINRVGYPPAIASGELVRSIDHRGIFWDVGTPERLLEANLRLLGGQERLKHTDAFEGLRSLPRPESSSSRGRNVFSAAKNGRIFVARGAKIAKGAKIVSPALIGEGATIEAGATVGPYAVVGAGARLQKDADLSYSVVLSGATVARGRTLRGTILGNKTQATVDGSAVEASLSRRAGA